MQRNVRNGFTLVELLVTIGVAAILLGVAVPSFVTVIKNSRMTTGVNELVASMQFARSEAIKRRVPVTICRSDNAADEKPICAQGKGWHSGWLVFVDDADTDGDGSADGNGDYEAGEEVLRVRGALVESIEVKVTSAAAPLDDLLTYTASGFPRNQPVGVERNMVFCDDRNSNYAGRVLNLSPTGRPKVRLLAETGQLGIDCE